MRTKSSLLLLLALFSLSLSGCFPLALDVNEKGEMLIYRQEGFFIFHPASGKVTPFAAASGRIPVFAKFSPNGKDALLVTDSGGDNYRFDLAPLAGGQARTI